MGLKSEIESKVKEYLANGAYDIKDIEYVPTKDDKNITFGNKAVRFRGCVLYIDMRDSTTVIDDHHNYTAAKIHKAFLHIATKLINANGGEIRSFNGDSILAFFCGNTKSNIQKTVQCAMQIKYMLSEVCKSSFEKYHSLDYDIGIDYGDITVVKGGVAFNNNNNDLLWISKAVNFAAKMGDSANAPYNIKISKVVYDNLSDDLIYHIGDSLIYGNQIKTNMWQSNPFFKLGSDFAMVYSTNYYFTVS